MSQVKDKKLWEKCKKEAMGNKTRWDARIAQRSVKLYKQKGGKYIGPKPKSNSMIKWTEEKWEYRDKNKTGRYLPRAVWNELTLSQKRETNKNKRNGKKGKNVPWEPYVLKAFKKTGIKHK